MDTLTLTIIGPIILFATSLYLFYVGKQTYKFVTNQINERPGDIALWNERKNLLQMCLAVVFLLNFANIMTVLGVDNHSVWFLFNLSTLSIYFKFMNLMKK